MEKLGGNFEESRGQFFDRLKTCFEEHEEAINVFKNQIKNKEYTPLGNGKNPEELQEWRQKNGLKQAKIKQVKTQ